MSGAAVDPTEFAGRRALVTGAGGGIGRSIALSLAARGCDVCVLDVSDAGAQQTAQAIRSLGRKAHVLIQNMGHAEVVVEIERAGASFGTFDILVNNAGISPKKADGLKEMLWDIAPEQWVQIVDINLNGYFYALRAVLPGMLAQRRGAVVNIASLAGVRYSSIAGAAYATTKAAVVGLTRQAAGEVAEHGVRINAIAPGRIESDMAAVAGKSFNEAIRQSTPLRRLGQPQDIAEAALFLLSERASFITGETLVVSGGRGL